MSRTLRVSTPCTAIRTGRRSSSGRSTSRPRLGLSPTSPQHAAGIRMEPPPSFACAIGTTPAATSAADPPLEPPAERVGSHGLRVAPYRSDSVVAVSPNSGSVVLASGTIPSRSICATHGELDRAGRSATAREPCPVGKPARSSLSFTTDGMPASGAFATIRPAWMPGSTTSAPPSPPRSAPARRRELVRPPRRTAPGPDTSPARSRVASAVTSSVPSASSAVASTRTVAASMSTQRR